MLHVGVDLIEADNLAQNYFNKTWANVNANDKHDDETKITSPQQWTYKQSAIHFLYAH